MAYLGDTDAQDQDYQECLTQNDAGTCRQMIYTSAFNVEEIGQGLTSGFMAGWSTEKKVAAVAGASILTWLLLL